MTADGGGKATALRRALHGRRAVGLFLVRVLRNPTVRGGVAEGQIHWFNGAPGWLRYEDGELVTAIAWTIAGGEIREIFALRNPDKLAHFAALQRSSQRSQGPA